MAGDLICNHQFLYGSYQQVGKAGFNIQRGRPNTLLQLGQEIDGANNGT